MAEFLGLIKHYGGTRFERSWEGRDRVTADLAINNQACAVKMTREMTLSPEVIEPASKGDP